MSVFKVKRTADAVKESTGGGKFISDSGIYDVTIKIASIKANQHDARAIDFNVEYEGNTTTLYGLKLDNNDGSENYQAKIFNKLCIIADLDEVQDPEAETHKLGKDGKEVDLMVLPDFTDLECKVRVQAEYSKWNREVKKKLVIRNFYRADGASADEIVSETEIGKHLARDLEIASQDRLVDVTDDEVAAFKNKGKSDTPAKSAPKETSTAPAKNLFAR